MGVLFESILLFSLAVLIILVGLLVYYFKKRIVDIEQKNAKCLEIVQDVYMQQMQMKKEIYSILFQQQPQQQQQHQHQHQFVKSTDDKIRVELSEESEDDELSDDDLSDDSESDDESIESTKSMNESNKIKVINVNLAFPEECDINIDEYESDEEEIIDEPESEIISMDQPESIIVNKVEEPSKKSNSKEELQKMSPASLKSLLISKGIHAESVNKLKKKELVDMLVSLV